MKILIVTEALERQEGCISPIELSRELNNMGQEVTLACVASPDALPEIPGIAMQAIPSLGSPKACFALKRLIKNGGYEIVQSLGTGAVAACSAVRFKSNTFRHVCAVFSSEQLSFAVRNAVLYCDRALTRSQEAKQALIDACGIYSDNISVLPDNLSALDMARKCLEVYGALPALDRSGSSDVILSGYYGFGNMGDDSILLSVIRQLRDIDPGVRIVALTRDPKRSQIKYGVRCVDRMNIFSILREIRRSRLLISGGGSLLQNNTSEKSLIYYVTVMRLAKKAGIPVMVYSNGIGPVYGAKGRERVRKALDMTDAVSLRESSSLELMREIGATVDERVRVSCDPALTVEPVEDGRREFLYGRLGLSRDRHGYYAVSVRDYADLKTGDGASSEELADRVSIAMAEIYKRTGLIPVVVSIQNGTDDGISHLVCEKFERYSSCRGIYAEGLSARELVALLAGMEFVVGMRLHMLIYATNACIPAIGLSYDPKVSAFLEYLGQGAPIEASELTADELVDKVMEIMETRETSRQRIKARKNEMLQLMRRDAEQAMELVRKKAP